MIAAVADVGMPSVSSGTSVPENDALLAASGPATPSIAPSPHSASLRSAAARSRRTGTSAPRRRPPAARRTGTRSPRRAATASTSAASPRATASAPTPSALQHLLLALARAQLGRHVQRLADREQPDGDDHDVDPVAELVDAERQPRLAGQLVDPDEPDQQPDRQRREAADQRRATSARSPTRTPAASARSSPRRGTSPPGDATGSASSVSATMPIVPATNEPIAAVASAARPRPRLAISKPSIAVATDDDSPGVFKQDRRRRPAVHPARVDAGEQDERADRIAEVERDRQQQRDRQRRPDPRQHADQRPERHARRGQQQVLGREDGAEAVEQVGREDQHSDAPGPGRQLHVEPVRERVGGHDAEPERRRSASRPGRSEPSSHAASQKKIVVASA